MLRCKVICYKKSITDSEGNGEVQFRPPTFASGEDKEYFKYAPNGDIILSVLNKSAMDMISVGKEYYIDFTEVN